MTSLTLVRRIGARPEIVFSALSTSEGVAHWWGCGDAGPVLIADIDARVGGRFRVLFRMLDGTEHEVRGEYLEVVYSKRLVMTWQWTVGGEPDERDNVSRVTIDLRPIDSGTELTFTHEQLQTEISSDSHKWGWSGALDKLERYLSVESEVVATP